MTACSTWRAAIGQFTRSAGTKRALLLFVVSATVGAAVQIFVDHGNFSDLRIYQIEGRAILKGWNLYGRLPGVHGHATYPPFAATIFSPTAAIPASLLKAVNFVVTVGVLAWVSVAACRLAGMPQQHLVRNGLILAAAGLWCEPVGKTIFYGQINLVLLALVLWDFGQPDDSRWRGLGTGLAAAIKVTPGIFIIYLLLTRRLRFAATATGTFAAALAISAMINLDETRAYWTHDLFQVDRVGRLENAVNQTVRGFLVRADHTRATRPTELLLVLVVLIVGLVCAVVAYQRLGDCWGLPTCAITGLLTSPIAWSHHWVWCIPITALLWQHARRWVLPTIAIFWSWAVWAIPHAHGEELHLSQLQIAISGWYVFFGLGFIGLTAYRVAQQRRDEWDVAAVASELLSESPEHLKALGSPSMTTMAPES